MTNLSDSIIEKVTKRTPRRHNISMRQFYRYRFAIRSSFKENAEFHWLWFARKLAEFFVITVLNRIERHEMEHVKKSQKERNLRKILASEFIAALEKGVQRQYPNAKLGNVFLMPQTFLGSRQYYQKQYADLMAMIRKLGNPTWYFFCFFLIFKFL